MAEGFSAAREARIDFCCFLYGLKPVPFRIFRFVEGFAPRPTGRWNPGGVGFPGLRPLGRTASMGYFRWLPPEAGGVYLRA